MKMARRKRAYYNYEKGIAVDKKGNQVNGKYLDDVVKALNYDKDGDTKGIMKAIATGKKTVNVKETDGDGGAHKKGTIYWNPTSGLKMMTLHAIEMPDGYGGVKTVQYVDYTGEKQSPALQLLHESGHAYEYMYDRKGYKDRAGVRDAQYGWAEERFVIENFETPAANKLHEGTRTNHGGEPYPTDGPTSTKSLY